MTGISGINRHSQHASILAAKKAAFAPIRFTQELQQDRDRVAKTVTAAPALDETRENLNLTDTYQADDTFANTEAMKLRGGRLDLIV